MKKYVNEYFRRGMMFAGFGPVIFGMIILILSKTVADFSISGTDVFTGILSTYVLAFVHAGASVFNQIDEWGISKSVFSIFQLSI